MTTTHKVVIAVVVLGLYGAVRFGGMTNDNTEQADSSPKEAQAIQAVETIPYRILKTYDYGFFAIIDSQYRNEESMRKLGDMLDKGAGDKKWWNVEVWDSEEMYALRDKMLDEGELGDKIARSLIGVYSKDGAGRNWQIRLNGYDKGVLQVSYK